MAVGFLTLGLGSSFGEWLPNFLLGAGLGIAGAAHCAGMCGMLPLSFLHASKDFKKNLAPSLLYNFGRGFVYIILSLTATGLGVAFGKVSGLAETGQWAASALSFMVAFIMLVTALFLFGIRLPLLRQAHQGVISKYFIRLSQRFLKNRQGLSPFILGSINGFLPCPLVYAMLALSIGFGAKEGIQGLPLALSLGIGFALGTWPVMLGMSFLGGRYTLGFKQRFTKIAAVCMLFFAALTFMRALNLEFLHTILPGSSHHHGLVLHNEDFAKYHQGLENAGVTMAKPKDMSETQYEELQEEEADLAKKIAGLIASGRTEELRKLDQNLSHPEGKRCFTLTPQDLEDISADQSAPEKFPFRCACCGTEKVIKKKNLFEGITLLLEEEQELPWKQR